MIENTTVVVRYIMSWAECLSPPTLKKKPTIETDEMNLRRWHWFDHYPYFLIYARDNLG